MSVFSVFVLASWEQNNTQGFINLKHQCTWQLCTTEEIAIMWQLKLKCKFRKANIVDGGLREIRECDDILKFWRVSSAGNNARSGRHTCCACDNQEKTGESGMFRGVQVQWSQLVCTTEGIWHTEPCLNKIQMLVYQLPKWRGENGMGKCCKPKSNLYRLHEYYDLMLLFLTKTKNTKKIF